MNDGREIDVIGTPPNTVSQPTFGHPWCDRCGAVLVLPVERHIAEHARVDERLQVLSDAAAVIAMHVFPESIADLPSDVFDELTETLQRIKDGAAR